MRQFHKNTEQKIEKLVAELEGSPAIAEIREQEAKQNLEKRQAAAAQLKSFECEAEKFATNAELDPLEKDLARIGAELQKAQTALNESKRSHLAAKFALEAKIRAEQNILYACYDARIDDAVQFFREKLDEIRAGKISSQRVGVVERNLFTEKIKSEIQSNKPAILQALKYCQEAIHILEEEKFAPDFDVVKIDKLKAEIPGVDVFTSFETERRMPGIKIPDALDLIPNEEQENYQMGKLMEKAEKILGR